MFQLKQIQEAHSKVKSGADFPAYIQDLIKIDVIKYVTYVDDGHAVFFGPNGYEVVSDPKYSKMNVADVSDKEKFIAYLKMHQKGETDYKTFCEHSAETGGEKWTVDMNEMTCTYYDKAKSRMLEEQIPNV